MLAYVVVVIAVIVAVPAAAQTTPPVCYDGAQTWEGLCVREEESGARRGYVRADHADSEAALIRGLPFTLRETNAAGRMTAFTTPYTCKRFTVGGNGKADTDIEHIVALAEAHDSGLAPSLRHVLANDLLNQTVADRTVNRSQKSDKDAADWTPPRNGAWFADRVIRVKRRYGLSVDRAEAEALRALLLGGSPVLACP